MQLNRREKGVALVAALLTMLVVAGILTVIFARTLSEVQNTRDSAEATRTLFLARGAANVGLTLLNDPVKAEVDKIVMDTSSSTTRWAYDKTASSTSKRPDPGRVASALRQSVSTAVQTKVDAIVCNYANFGSLEGAVSVRIFFTSTACNKSLPNNVSLPTGRYFSGEGRDATSVGRQAYAIPFVLVAEGIEGVYKRNVVIQGEYIFELGRSSFARYAYFTESEKVTGGSNLFFNDLTLIDGPVHSNGNFALAYNPWFGGVVTSAGCSKANAAKTSCAVTATPGAIFRTESCSRFGCSSSDTFVSQSRMSPNDQAPSLGGTEPSFQEGVAWDARYIPLPQNSSDQAKIAGGKNPDGSTRSDKGITFPGSLASLTLKTVDANGAAPTKNAQGVWSGSSYQLITGCTTTSCTVYRVDEVTTDGVKSMRLSTCSATATTAEATCLSNFKASGQWVTSSVPFNGIVYTNGSIGKLSGPKRSTASNADTAAPAISSFAQLTLAASDQIRITSDLKYEDRPMEGNPTRNSDGTITPAQYVNPDSQNILGIYSSGGDIVIGNGNSDTSLNAPNNTSVDAVLMSGAESVLVENYSSGSPRGNFNLLGGMIQNVRGAFGTFSGTNNLKTGFNRIYTYDRRLRDGLAPPFFPTTGIDSVNWVRATVYGQREQVY